MPSNNIYEVDMKASTVRGGEMAYLKFFDRPRQNYVMSVEFEMSRSFNTKYVLLHYTTNFGATCKSETVFDVLKSELDKKKQKLTYMKFEVGNIENRNKIYF